MSSKIFALVVAVVCSLIGAVVLSIAGPLNPPGGAVSPTYKTLTEVEPRIAVNSTNTPGDAISVYKITQPGSYYLTGNMTGVSGKHGIYIAASKVTLDLNGFVLSGVSGSLSGISTISNGYSGISITNGVLAFWGQHGVDLASNYSFTCSRLKLISNSLYGIVVGHGGVISDCVASTNTAHGFMLGGSNSVTQCSAYTNGSNGFSAGYYCSFSGCTSVQNTLSGFSLGAANTVTGCSSSFNSGAGISVGNGSSVTACVALGNTLDGISCTYGALILNNCCDQNGNGSGSGAGIHATGSDNRIEGNNSTQADRGIEVAGYGNIIIRNTCATNTTDWVIAANNVFGPIIDRRAPASAAVNGFSATSTLGSTDANANFSY